MLHQSRLPDGLAAARGTVESPDGAPIAYLRVGSGPPLVVCHGSFASAQDWLAFAVEMAGTCTVHLYDRRGRGSSPYVSPDFAVDAEVDDLAAVVRIAGPGPAVLGHSFGGGCVLSWAARERFGGPVILYEPRHSIDGPVSAGHIPRSGGYSPTATGRPPYAPSWKRSSGFPRARSPARRCGSACGRRSTPSLTS